MEKRFVLLWADLRADMGHETNAFENVGYFLYCAVLRGTIIEMGASSRDRGLVYRRAGGISVCRDIVTKLVE